MSTPNKKSEPAEQFTHLHTLHIYQVLTLSSDLAISHSPTTTNARNPAGRHEIVGWVRKDGRWLTGVVLDRDLSIFSSDSRRLAAENKAANNQRE